MHLIPCFCLSTCLESIWRTQVGSRAIFINAHCAPRSRSCCAITIPFQQLWHHILFPYTLGVCLAISRLTVKKQTSKQATEIVHLGKTSKSWSWSGAFVCVCFQSAYSNVSSAQAYEALNLTLIEINHFQWSTFYVLVISEIICSKKYECPKCI